MDRVEVACKAAIAEDDAKLIECEEKTADFGDGNAVMVYREDYRRLLALARRGAAALVVPEGASISDKEVHLIRSIVAPMVCDRARMKGDAWDQAHDILLRVFCRRDASPPSTMLTEAEVRKDEREKCALIARCHADDRWGRDRPMDWHDGYIDGCRGAADAISKEDRP